MIDSTTSNAPDQFQVMLDNLASIVEKTSSQLSSWAYPYGGMMGILTVVVAVTAIVVVWYVWKISNDPEKLLKVINVMNTIKNVFRKYPITSLIVTNFVVVWLLPLSMMVGFKVGVLFKSIIVSWSAIPALVMFYVMAFSNIGRLPYELMNAGPMYTYILFIAPLSTFLIIWFKKKMTGVLNVKDVVAFIVFCFLLPVVYSYTCIIVNAFWNANFIM